MARNDRDTLGIGGRIYFSENRGQWEERVLFRSQMQGATLFAERDCFTLVVWNKADERLHHPVPQPDADGGRRHAKAHAYRMHFDGGKATSVEGLDREEGYENYYLGNDPSRWATGVNTYGAILYHDLWPAVDMKVYAAAGAMKYDFIVQPGGRVEDIVLRYEGAEGLRLRDGNLIVQTSAVDIVELRPYVYQMRGERQEEVSARYVIDGERVRLRVGRYDTTRTLIVDPLLYFSSYTGSTADNWGTTGCYDSQKNVYTSGLVFSSGYPVSMGAYDQSHNGNADIGIFKFNPTGTTRYYATYLGGNKADMPHSMYVNSFDELVIFGTTGSTNFPVTATAYDMSFNGGDSMAYEGSTTINFPYGVDLFISRFNSTGSQLQASTYVGGSGNDGLNYRNSFDNNVIMLGNDSLYFNYGDGARGELMTDDLNNIYIGTTTKSTDFPVTEGCIQSTNHGKQDGVVFKIDYNLSNLMWSTYLGGTKDDAIYSIDCDRDYNVVVCGGTNSTNFPTTEGAYKTTYQGGSADAFVAKISYYGTSLMTSTLFGSSAYDQAYFARCGKQDDIFIFGQTKAPGSTLISNANYNTPNSGQFLARFKPTLDSLVWSTVVGDGSGEPNISPTAFAVDICNRIYLCGWGRYFLGRTYYNSVYYPWNTLGTSNLTVTSDAYQSTTDGQDFYVMCLDVDANDLVYATFFGEQHVSNHAYSGGDHVDGGTSRFDRMGTLYQAACASCGSNDEFPITTGAYGQHNNSNNCNNAIFRLGVSEDFPVADFSTPAAICAPPGNATFSNSGRGDSFVWDFGDGTTQTTPTATPVSHTYSQPGLYTVTLVAHMTDGCKEYDTTSHPFMVLGNHEWQLDTLTTCSKIQQQIGLVPALGCHYHWTTGDVSDSTIANPFVNTSGTYVLIVTNQSSGCTDTVVQVVVMGEAEANIVGDTVSCNVPTVLSVETTSGNFVYHWSSQSDLSDTLNSDMSNGTYSFAPTGSAWYYLCVTDKLGCEKHDSIYVHFYEVFDSILTLDPSCPGANTGEACAVLTSSAVAPYQYNWGNGWTDQDCCVGLCAGEHTLQFKDSNGCQVTNSFTLVDPPRPVVDATVSHVHCMETCTGSITVQVTGNSTYSVMWVDDSSTTTTRDSLCPGVYVLQVTDSSGCITYDSIEVLEQVDITLEIVAGPNSCSDHCSGKATALVSGGDAPYLYNWSSGETTAAAEQLCPGMAVITVVDAHGCTLIDSIEIGEQHSFDEMHAWADDAFVFAGRSTTLHVTEVPQATYDWSPASPLDDPTSKDPVATLNDSTLFVVTVTDSIGCTWIDTVAVGCVHVNCGETNIFIPNAFTPNNDGKNDQLCFSGEWVQEFHISIFTRWGEKVYESDNLAECWDGRYRNNWCMPGVYVYYCRILCADGEESTLKGDITLIR